MGALALIPLGKAGAEFSVFEFGPPQVRTGPEATASDRIDDLVLKRLQELGLKPANVCSDVVFLRRAYLCVIGKIPTEAEAREFLESSRPDRRARLIDSLLEREEFADYWAMKWGDVLRVKAEFPIKLWPNAVQAYYRWIYLSMRTNKPYDQFVREMLVSNGSNFRVGPVNFYRATQDRTPKGIATTVAVTFMGERPEHWPPKKLEALSGFFAQLHYKSTLEWKEELVFWDPVADKDKVTSKAMFPDGKPATIAKGEDPRAVFAEWLLRPGNPWFARCVSNRVWCWLLGRGIIHEPDDIRPDNPPSNPALLDFLQQELTAAKFDLRHLYRIILNSQTFQLASVPAQDTPEAGNNFAHYVLRRMDAEVLIDALNQITGTTETYSSPIPEPFTFVPENLRAVEIGDGSITSSFLELFGRSPRDTGLEAERSRTIRPNQRLHLLNSTHVLNKIKVCPLVKDAGNEDLSLTDLVERIYLVVLSRAPSLEELEIAREHAASAGVRNFAADFVWALINLPEFDHIH